MNGTMLVPRCVYLSDGYESLIRLVLKEQTFNGFDVGKHVSIFLPYNTEACHEENCKTRCNCLIPTIFKYKQARHIVRAVCYIIQINETVLAHTLKSEVVSSLSIPKSGEDLGSCLLQPFSTDEQRDREMSPLGAAHQYCVFDVCGVFFSSILVYFCLC